MVLAIISLLCIPVLAQCTQFQPPQVVKVVDTVLPSKYIGSNASSVKAGEPIYHGSFLEARQHTAVDYWYEHIKHQGISAFGPSGYQMYRNVKDFGAKGDGVTDDTAAINAAIAAGGRCGRGCTSSSTTPAVVYFPSGTYLLSSSILDYYLTQLIGNPNNLPVLKGAPNFSGFGLIDGDKYFTENLNWGSTNVFLRQVRNFVFDLREVVVPNEGSATGIHWPTAQATSLQNIVFEMSGTKHVGIFSESGSAGFMTDLTFNGGLYGMQIGNQQFTTRNLVFNSCTTAISMFWDWGWVYQGLSINNCGRGIDISAGGLAAQSVGSVVIIDSSFVNTPTGIVTAYSNTSIPATAGSLILENVKINNVAVVVESVGATVLAGSIGASNIKAWGQGHSYTPNSTGPKQFQGAITGVVRSTILAPGGTYYVKSKPQYNTLPLPSFVSARSCGATGDGKTDDTTALQNAINTATAAGKVLFFDAGTYKVTSTITVPPGARLVGESYSVIMSAGPYFASMANPRPVVKIGSTGQTGRVEWSDMIVQTQGSQAGAILIEWNLASPTNNPSGVWDVHTRIGGTTGTNLQYAQCPTTQGSAVKADCIGAYMSMHITKSASGLYMENNWLWAADHDMDGGSNQQISVYSGRGLLIESAAGGLWLVGTGVEHHTLYQYQLTSTKEIYMGFIQTETPYYQPLPSAPAPFAVNPALHDPDFAASCVGSTAGNCANAWGLRIMNSSNIAVYGAGLYSFFDNYSTTCSNNPGPENCQTSIFSLEGTNKNVNVYTLVTIGTENMITVDGRRVASYSDNANVFTQAVAWFRSG